MRMVNKTTWTHWQIDLVGLLICVGLTLGMYTMGLAPLLHQHQHTAEQRDTLILKKRESTVLAAQLTTLKSRAIRMRQAIEQSPVTLESSARINHQLARLTHTLNQKAIRIDSVKTGRVYRSTHCDLVPIKLKGTSEYPSFVEALHELYQTVNDVGIVGFSLDTAQQKSEEWAHYNLDLFWYTAAVTQ